ncbi:MAG: hypothetical protein EHM41_13745 [Chloroflexi bacterium]|nr:MAG: hypothetical protein EHM41_13745 [Chloroflexota bacterium]
MNRILYEQYLKEYIREAIENSDGTNSGISQYLSGLRIPGRFTRNKEEKIRAIKDAQSAFEEHRHWPRDIVLSHLGLELD